MGAYDGPDIQQFGGYRFGRVMGGIASYELVENGLTVLLYPQELAPVAVFMVTYRVGSRNESVGETGATHFLEHMMFKGTERYNRELGTSIFSTLQRTGARVNATTWLDRTNYYELLPDDRLELAVEIEADRMRGARLSDDDVESERTVILNEFERGQNEPMRRLYHAVWASAFTAHPYGHPTIGWRSDIENLSSADLRSFYDRFYWPENTTISVIGSFDTPRTMAIIREKFGQIPRAAEPVPVLRTTEPPQIGERRTVIRMAGEPPLVIMGFVCPNARTEESAVLDVIAGVLSGGRTGRLTRRLVDTGLTTSIHASNSALRDPGLFMILASLAPGSTHASVESAIREELDHIIDNPVSDDELTREINRIRVDQAFSNDGAFSVASELNEAIAAGDWTLYPRRVERTASVSGEDIQRVAGETFRTARMTVGNFIPDSTA